jgi:hypothetical protein
MDVIKGLMDISELTGNSCQICVMDTTELQSIRVSNSLCGTAKSKNSSVVFF